MRLLNRIKYFISNIPIKIKLLLLSFITCFIVLTSCFITILLLDIKDYKNTKIKSLQSMAQIIGSSNISALEFLDNKSATETLSDLKVETDVINATVLNEAGNEFANYTRKGNSPYHFKKEKVQKTNFEFIENHLFVYHKIINKNELLGYVCLKADLTNFRKMVRIKIEIAIIVLLIGLGLAFIISSFLQMFISVPILNLKNLMEKVKTTENFSNRAIVEGNDEVGALSKVYNDMLSQIERREAQLKKAKAIAEESNAAKDVFLSSMSHEIRTPMNAIIGFQQLLKETPLSEEQEEFVESIDFACKNLLVIINDILDLSKIEAGRFEFTEEAFNLTKVTNGVIELTEPNARIKNLKMYSSYDPKIPQFLLGDSSRLSQILINLVGNAVKFTQSGHIKISITVLEDTEEDSLCEFNIEDTGIGIPEEKIGNIFERFTQASATTTRKYGGTGLGLTISKYLVEMQGGQISVKSKVGEGSVFTFVLRFKKTEEGITTDKPKESPSVNGKPEQELRILLAEDIKLNQNLMVRIFNKTPHHLDIASNGKEAIEKLTENNYDLILMDIQMPEMDGCQATKYIRKMADKKKRNIPIVALTAYASQNEIQRFLKVGMNGYITKPFNKKDLLETIDSLVQNGSGQLKKEATKEDEPQQQGQDNLYSLSFVEETGEGDKDFIANMINIYLSEIQIQLKDLFNALNEKKYKHAGMIAHKIRNLAIPFKIRKGIELSNDIEKEAYTTKNSDKLQRKSKELESLMLKVAESLRQDLSRYSA